MFRDRIQMRHEVTEGDLGTNRDTIIQYVQIVLLEVHNPFPARILYIGVPDVPFLRYGPVEDRRSRWYLRDL